jgi:hypothetical protein
MNDRGSALAVLFLCAVWQAACGGGGSAIESTPTPPGVAVSISPGRWRRFLGNGASTEALEHLLRSELSEAFGSAKDLFDEMKVKTVFKGVTYESLSDPEFIRVAREAIP